MPPRPLSLLPLAAIGLLAAGWPACQPSGTTAAPASVLAKNACGFTVLYQNDAYGEIEPCG